MLHLHASHHRRQHTNQSLAPMDAGCDRTRHTVPLSAIPRVEVDLDVVTTHNQSRDHGEQRLGILSLLAQIRISTLDIARDADIEIPTSRPLDYIGNHAALTMDILIHLIALLHFLTMILMYALFRSIT